MARAWEAEFIRLWEAGATQADIATALGIAAGTARSRAYTLQQEGKLALRPRGGRRVPRAGAPSAPTGAPKTGAPWSPPTSAEPTPSVHPGALSAEDLALWQELKTHWPALKALLAPSAPSAPSGAPQRPRKKGFVLGEQWITLLGRYAQATHTTQRAVLEAALQAYFDQQGWLGAETPAP